MIRRPGMGIPPAHAAIIAALALLGWYLFGWGVWLIGLIVNWLWD